ncbi:hypothetical protein D7X33_37105, partial [Butyricicoccus sp. 1XD8-22]
ATDKTIATKKNRRNNVPTKLSASIFHITPLLFKKDFYSLLKWIIISVMKHWSIYWLYIIMVILNRNRFV